jgi:hypothetical protein
MSISSLSNSSMVLAFTGRKQVARASPTAFDLVGFLQRLLCSRRSAGVNTKSVGHASIRDSDIDFAQRGQDSDASAAASKSLA